MAKGYIPIFFDWMEVTEELNDQEKGRLIDAMVLYASGGDWQERIKGNERYLFPAFRGQIDRNNEISEMRASVRRKVEQNKTNENKTEQNITNFPKEKDKENNNKKENNNTIRKKDDSDLLAMFERFWAEYPRKTDKKKAYDSFKKIKPDEALMQTILMAIDKQKKSQQWQEDGGRFIPHPTTWLNGRRWEDQIIAGSSVKNAATQYEQRDYSSDTESLAEMLDRLQGKEAQ